MTCTTSKLVILEATYGRECPNVIWGGATSVVKDKCDYKNTCTFVADPDLLGDDDRYCIKSTGITYRCTNGVPMAGGGSGGRMAAYYHTSYFTGKISVEGGRSFNEPGSSGTAYLERYAHVNGSGLTEEVRTKRGLAYSVYSYFSPLLVRGPFQIGMQTQREQAQQARALCAGDVEVLELPIDDSWLRDSGPIFVRGDEGARVGVHFRFNA